MDLNLILKLADARNSLATLFSAEFVHSSESAWPSGDRFPEGLMPWHKLQMQTGISCMFDRHGLAGSLLNHMMV